MRILFLTIFSSIALGNTCPNGFVGFDSIEGEAVATKACVTGRSNKLNKAIVCGCHSQNKILKLDTSNKFKKIRKDSGEKILKESLAQLERNIAITLDNAYSLSQFSNESLGESCNIHKLDRINERCGSDKTKLLGSVYPNRSVLLEIKQKIKNERLIREDPNRSKAEGLFKRELKACSIPETKGYLATGQKGMIFIQRLIEVYGSEIKSSGSKSLNNFIDLNSKKISEDAEISLAELTTMRTNIEKNPLFWNMLKSEELAKNPTKGQIGRLTDSTLNSLKESCSKSFESIAKIACNNADEPIGMDISYYKDYGLKDSKGDLDKEYNNQVLSELMCSESEHNIPESIKSLKDYFSDHGGSSDEDAAVISEANYRAQIISPMNNICSYYPDIENGLSRENCKANSIKPICLDLETYGALNLIPETIAKTDEDGNIIEDESGNTLQIPNPDYISSKDVDSAIFGKGSLVDSFFTDPKDKETSKTAESSTNTSSSNSNSLGNIGNKTDKRQALNATFQQGQKESLNKFSTSFGLGGNGSDKSIAEGNKRIYDKLKNLVDSYGKKSPLKDSERLGNSSLPSRSIASTNTSQQIPSNTPFVTAPPKNNGISASKAEEEYENNSIYDENNSFGKDRKVASGSNSSPFIDEKGNDPTRNRGPNGKYNNGIQLKPNSEEDLTPVLELYGNLEDEFLSIDDPEMLNEMLKLDDSQKEILKKLKKLMEAKEPFYISQKSSDKVRVYLKYNGTEYVIEETFDENKYPKRYMKKDFINFKTNISNAIKSGVLKRISDLSIETN